MTPGPYSICHTTFESIDSDAPTLTTLKFWYDSAASAYSNLSAVAKDNNLESGECIVIRVIEEIEAAAFTQ